MESSLLLFAGAVLRVSVVLGAGLLFIRLGRRYAASIRYEAAVLGLASAVIIPLLLFVMPAWQILPQLPMDVVTLDQRVVPEDQDTFPDSSVQSGQVSTQGRVSPGSGSSERASQNVMVEAMAFVVGRLRALSLYELIILVWALGILAVLTRALHARWVLSRMWGQAEPAVGDVWDDVIEEAGDRVFLTRHVSVRQLGDIRSPMTWGIIRPKLLLPAEAVSWSRERKLNAVMHELVHVRRRDALHDVLSVFVLAVHWFNPLAWALRQQLKVQREASCDEEVLDLGADPQEYAQMLIDVAKEMKLRRSAPRFAMTIARPSQLEGRILSILNHPGRTRKQGIWIRRSVASFCAVLVLVATAAAPSEQGDASWDSPSSTQPLSQALPDAASPALPAGADQEQFSDADQEKAAGEVDGPSGHGTETVAQRPDDGDTTIDLSAAEPVDWAALLDGKEDANPIEDFLAVAGLRMADAALAELGTTIAEVDWQALFEGSDIKLELTFDEKQAIKEELSGDAASFDDAVGSVSSRIEHAVVDELERVIREEAGTNKSRRAIRALIEIDSAYSRAALKRLGVRDVPR